MMNFWISIAAFLTHGAASILAGGPQHNGSFEAEPAVHFPEQSAHQKRSSDDTKEPPSLAVVLGAIGLVIAVLIIFGCLFSKSMERHERRLLAPVTNEPPSYDIPLQDRGRPLQRRDSDEEWLFQSSGTQPQYPERTLTRRESGQGWYGTDQTVNGGGFGIQGRSSDPEREHSGCR